MIRLTAAKGVLPAKFETKNPSTTLYIDVKIIMAMEGAVNINSFLYVKWSESFICILPPGGTGVCAHDGYFITL